MPTRPGPTNLDGGIRTRPLVIAIGASLTLHAAILAGVGVWGFPAPSGPRTDVEGGITLLDIPVAPPAAAEPEATAPDTQPDATSQPDPSIEVPPDANATVDAPPIEPIAPRVTDTSVVSTVLAPVIEPRPAAPARVQENAPRRQARPPATAAPAPAARPSPVSFAGSRGHAAERIVYVIDASGAMTASLPIVKQQLNASVSGLSDAQRFTVIVPRAGARDQKNLFSGGLTPASPASRGDLAAWLTTIQPGGGSDVVAGLSWALELQPDLIYVLTYRFARTGVASEQSTAEVLARLDALNPGRQGKRPVVIKTIQMIGEDPTGLLQAIAQAHGDGEGSYRVLELPKRR